jgi:hypothetical protein
MAGAVGTAGDESHRRSARRRDVRIARLREDAAARRLLVVGKLRRGMRAGRIRKRPSTFAASVRILFCGVGVLRICHRRSRASLSFSIGHHGLCSSLRLRPKHGIFDRWSAIPVTECRARARPVQDGRDPAATTLAHRNGRCSDSCSTFNDPATILLLALIGGVLLDVAVPALVIEVLASASVVLTLDLPIGAGAFVAPLLRRNRRQIRHCRSSVRERTSTSPCVTRSYQQRPPTLPTAPTNSAKTGDQSGR